MVSVYSDLNKDSQEIRFEVLDKSRPQNGELDYILKLTLVNQELLVHVPSRNCLLQICIIIIIVFYTIQIFKNRQTNYSFHGNSGGTFY